MSQQNRVYITEVYLEDFQGFLQSLESFRMGPTCIQQPPALTAPQNISIHMSQVGYRGREKGESKSGKFL